MELLDLQQGIEFQSESIETRSAAECLENQENNIERRRSGELLYDEFYWKYMKANVPVVLTAVSNEWECRKNWTWFPKSNVGKRTINFDFLRNKIKDVSVPVADCTQKYFNSHVKMNMSFHEYLDHWISKIRLKEDIEENSNITASDNDNDTTTKNLYLKDWHLKALMPDYDFYRVPKHFASDWLNEYLIATNRDDYRFVYMGPKGSWTPFHADVFGSYSWSTNIMGCKKWLILPPGEEMKLEVRGQLPFTIDEAILKEKHVHFTTLYQEENEAIFVPSGYYHTVLNLTDTISVNHNFYNACNLAKIWCNLASNMQQVIAEIEDCRQMDNFNEHCQTMLRASFGMNYLDFLDMLEFITKRRLLNKNGNNEQSSAAVLFDRYMLSDYHIRHDVLTIQRVLELMIKDNNVKDSRADLYRRCINLLEFIREKNIN